MAVAFKDKYYQTHFSENASVIMFVYGCMVGSWIVSELIRYPFYLCKFLEEKFPKAPSLQMPYTILYLRYTAFIFLYPIGFVIGETGGYIMLLKLLKTTSDTSWFVYDMPNSLNFIFRWNWFLYAYLFITAAGFLQLYSYMFTQRAKNLKIKNPKTKIH
ncbi:hypothetical protein RFI_18036 [Reticulomyxa filosa]|uniref:very-long-chain (3R)-3-hydroxyacyl-CoA dehydratase n=1 Tax=Reticulomyxa filosa TaxID=46433 RepID=X6MZW6_RETFI|nr:hypothetical protein RFI_18036 [Reticulomyxa filosa]|eukprot:ETO19193.1 hypothetical protein RFI_18036 [Reticulomyxa filosa]